MVWVNTLVKKTNYERREMDIHKSQKTSFFGIAIAFIVIGVIIFGFSFAAWVLSYFADLDAVAYPAMKAIGGLFLIVSGYILLELELIRQK